jgi:predicted acetyltransferase
VAIRLERPNEQLLAAYADALRAGWSPSNVEDLSGRHLAAIEADAAAFLADYDWSPGKTIALGDGRLVPRLPGQLYWVSDGAFCGVISFRYQTGTIDLPATVSGHLGYAIIPWKRRQGIATQAVRVLLPIARKAGFERVLVTTDPGNIASQRVILSAGGVRAEDMPDSDQFGPRLGFWLHTAR